MKKPKKTTDALVILDRMTAGDQEMARLIEGARFAADIGQMIYDARIAARLTQQRLAERTGTKQSVIARLENANYEGHSLRILRRVAEALQCELVLRFEPARVTRRARTAQRSRPRRMRPLRSRVAEPHRPSGSRHSS